MRVNFLPVGRFFLNECICEIEPENFLLRSFFIFLKIMTSQEVELQQKIALTRRFFRSLDPGRSGSLPCAPGGIRHLRSQLRQSRSFGSEARSRGSSYSRNIAASFESLAQPKQFGCSVAVRPEGFEPPTTGSKPVVISISPRAQCKNFYDAEFSGGIPFSRIVSIGQFSSFRNIEVCPRNAPWGISPTDAFIIQPK